MRRPRGGRLAESSGTVATRASVGDETTLGADATFPDPPRAAPWFDRLALQSGELGSRSTLRNADALTRALRVRMRGREWALTSWPFEVGLL